MSNRPSQDPLEATFRDLRGPVCTGDGRAPMAAIERRPDLETLQHMGDGLPVDLDELSCALEGDPLLTDDRRRGRARQWLAGSGLRPTMSVEPAALGRPGLHGLP